MARIRVPLLSFRLLLFFSIFFLVSAAFVSGLLLTAGGGTTDAVYNPKALDSLLEAAGVPVLLKETGGGYGRLDTAGLLLTRHPRITSVAVALRGDRVVWSLPAGAGALTGADLIAGAAGRLSGNRLFRDANRKEYLYIRGYTIGKREFVVLVRLLDRPSLAERLLGPLEAGFSRAFGGSWYKPVAIIGVLILATLLLVFSSTAAFLVRPVRLFAGMLERWEKSPLPGSRSLGLLRGSVEFVEELVARRGGAVRAEAPEAVLDQLLPVRQGFDYPHLETAAFFLKNLEERKDFYDVFALPDGRLCLFRGEVSGHGHEASVATARMALAAQAYCRSYDEPARVISEVNRFFHAVSGSIAVSLFVGFLDTGKRDLLFSQAGGLPLYHFAAGATPPTPYHLDIPPAGIIPPDMYRERLQSGRLTLEPGHLYALITDGILKVRDFDWEARSAELLSGGGMIGARVISFRNALSEALETHPLGDDLAALFFAVE